MISSTSSGEFILTDLGSTNGTRVNGMPVAQGRALRDGEKLLERVASADGAGYRTKANGKNCVAY